MTTIQGNIVHYSTYILELHRKCSNKVIFSRLLFLLQKQMSVIQISYIHILQGRVHRNMDKVLPFPHNLCRLSNAKAEIAL